MRTVNSALADDLRAYLPATLLDAWTESPRRPPVWGEWLDGSLMHCDITGFTAMSEALARLGKEGAEITAAVLNRFFHRMLDIAARWGGVQMKFGGDAMLLYFSGQDHVAMAGACALEMQRAMADFRRIQAGGMTPRLRMRAGIHSGSFYSVSVGQADGLLHYMLMGHDVNRVAEVEPAARPGQVVLSSESACQLPTGATIQPAGQGLYRLRGFDTPLPPPASGLRAAVPAVASRYVLPTVSSAAPEGRIIVASGEHRRVTAVFISLLGSSRLLKTRGAQDTLAQVNEYLNALLSLLESHGGFLAGSDIDERGDKLIVLFGAPVSLEGQEAAALRFAADLRQRLAEMRLGLRHCIGVNTGSVFAGEIGSPRRREYTVIGDAVNLAARLMATAKPGEVIVSGSTAARCQDAFNLSRMRPLRVKGKTARVQAFRLGGPAGPPPSTREAPLAIVGRERETAALWRAARQASRGRSRWAFISGEAGIGKSRLVAELAARLSAAGDSRLLMAESHSHTAGVPFGPWIQPLRILLGLRGDEADAQRVLTEVSRLAPGAEPFSPLVAELLGPRMDGAEGIASLEAGARRQGLVDTIVRVLAGAARERPLLLWFEDVHWADPQSLLLLERLTAGLDAPAFVCLTSRKEEPPRALTSSRPAVNIKLTPLSKVAARQMLTADASLPDTRVEALLERAQGNPFFLKELARAGREGADLPETVNDLLMSRLDALDPAARAVVRVAAVVGPSFQEHELAALLLGRMNASRLRRALDILIERGFARADTAAGYTFGHALVRDAVYESLPYAQRRRFHGVFVEYLERTHGAELYKLCELLLHHSERADDTRRTVRYAALSGERAAAVFAGEAALDYYSRSLGALSRLRRRSGAERSLLVERTGDCLETMGRHREAATAYQDSLREWREFPARHRSSSLLHLRWDAARESDLCRKAGVSLERASDYEAASRWLDEALSALPPRRPRLGAQICGAKSVSLFRRGRYQEGADWGRRAVNLAVRSRDPREMAYARNMLANSYMEAGALRKAHLQQRLAVRLYHELRDVPGQASANNNLGKCYHLQGVLDAALYHYQVALQADERVGDAVDAVIVRNNIGEALLALGRLDEAASYLEDVVQAQESNDELAAVAGLAQISLCRCRCRQGFLDDARRHLRRGYGLLRRVGAQGLLLEADLQRVELLLAAGRPQAARRTARRALAGAKEANTMLLEARAERLLGCVLDALGLSRQAEIHIRSAVTISRRIGAEDEEAHAYLALAAHILEDTRGPSARALARMALNIFARMGAELDRRRAESLLERASR